MNEISFLFENEYSNTSGNIKKGMLEIPSSLLKSTKNIDFDVDSLKNRLNEVITNISQLVSVDNACLNGFEIDEIEFGINIGIDGKVSVVALEGSSSLSTTIKVKLKRA